MERYYGGLDLSPGSTGLVLISDDREDSWYRHFELSDTKKSLRHRHEMANQVIQALSQRPVLLCIEDYALNRAGHVSYQIAEVGGMVRAFLLDGGFPFALVNPSKLKSYVLPKRFEGKGPVVDWAREHGFTPKQKTRGGSGYYRRQIEDLSDAFVLACMARDLAMHLAEGPVPMKRNIFLDPEYGLAFRDDLIYNCEKVTADAATV